MLKRKLLAICYSFRKISDEFSVGSLCLCLFRFVPFETSDSIGRCFICSYLCSHQTIDFIFVYARYSVRTEMVVASCFVFSTIHRSIRKPFTRPLIKFIHEKIEVNEGDGKNWKETKETKAKNIDISWN